MFEILEFYAGKDILLDPLLKRLIDFGYKRQDQVLIEGDFSLRGAVFDVFPLHFNLPIRIELCNDCVESIHTFDPDSGKRLDAHPMVIVLPMESRRRSWSGASNWRKQFLSSGTSGRTKDEGVESPIDPFIDIKTGDYIVHSIHGIAIYRGLAKIKNTRGNPEDNFQLEFADKNLLYVPTRDLHLVQRYISFGKLKPELSKLGSKRWQLIKDKTRQGIFSFASELLDIQAKRRALEGYTFPHDSEWQKSLEDEFPYEETPDQIKAVADVKRDLESKVPMDRLLCGDVGYGKTEVALRAAFKVVMSGKQVAMLVPTTILAEQHFDTFSLRMKNYPVTLRMLSRFQTEGERKRIIVEMKSGACDIVIGTHALLSDQIVFKDLGLVIVDEEQRFGVKHKEQLKKLRLLVDVLTLTATPIPRTLYLSLVGARDMSTINTPPKNRRPIQTVIAEMSDDFIKRAIQKELDRQGQVFYIHNRVQGIEFTAKKIQALLPKARIGVGHGQMTPKVLEAVMRKFIHGELDVLISTTIVESGIDIPNANTLIVERADLFGLSELYQLRGRVGRFDRQAHAYFLIPKHTVLTEESTRRLEAMERFTHLGSGFSLAMEDLEIRGAGNILGVEQHGYISNIGFDLYCRILKDTIDLLSCAGKKGKMSKQR